MMITLNHEYDQVLLKQQLRKFEAQVQTMYKRKNKIRPAQFSVSSWCMINLEGEIKTRENPRVSKIRQLNQRALDETRTAEILERSRKENEVYFDEHKRLHEMGI